MTLFERDLISPVEEVLSPVEQVFSPEHEIRTGELVEIPEERQVDEVQNRRTARWCQMPSVDEQSYWFDNPMGNERLWVIVTNSKEFAELYSF